MTAIKKNNMKITIIIIFALIFNACNNKNKTNSESYPPKTNKINNKSINPSNNITIYELNIIDSISHNPNYYTQGLTFHNQTLYEGTGIEGASALIKYKKDKHSIDKIVSLKSDIFGEGITILNDKIYQISWLNQTCFVYDLHKFKQIKELTYAGEGWGLTNNDSTLIMSDGTANIKFIEPNNFRTIKNLQIVSQNNIPVSFINEIELINDTLLFANIYMRDIIIIANINTGKVVGEINISILRKYLHNNPEQEVANGIAYDKTKNLFYFTGKNWNKIFIVQLKEIK